MISDKQFTQESGIDTLPSEFVEFALFTVEFTSKGGGKHNLWRVRRKRNNKANQKRWAKQEEKRKQANLAIYQQHYASGEWERGIPFAKVAKYHKTR